MSFSDPRAPSTRSNCVTMSCQSEMKGSACFKPRKIDRTVSHLSQPASSVLQTRSQSVKALQSLDNQIRTCPCDQRLKTPDTEIDQSSTLLRYTNPYQVVMNIRKTDIKPKPREVGAKPESQLLTDNSPETQEVLDCIQEPRMWMKDGVLWTQVVSPATTKRHEILLLYDDVNRRLWKQHARPYGMCRVRYILMNQLFDELTRQVTVTCAERGLFLVRIRAELNYSIQVYHYMWRDMMEYFDPIVQKSVEIMAGVRSQVEELEAEIKSIKEEMEDVHWKTVLMEQEKAYERQAMLEWYRCRIEEEKLQMQRLSTLYGAMTSGDFNVMDTSDILSLDDDMAKEPVKQKMESNLDVLQALQLSDTLKDLIQERKVAEGRRKTKRLLEDELVWAKGEISTNKAYATDLTRIKEPMDFDKWLTYLVQGLDDPTEITIALGYDVGQSPTELDQSVNQVREKTPDSGKMTTKPKITLIKWLMGREPGKCKCVASDCRGEMCATIDWNLLIEQARAEFLRGYDDRPLVTFNEFMTNWLMKKDVRDIYALNHFFEDVHQSYQIGSTSNSAMSITEERTSVTPKDDKVNFHWPSRFTKRMTEYSSPKNPFKLQSSSLRPNFRKEGRIRLYDSTFYADPFAPRAKDPCPR